MTDLYVNKNGFKCVPSQLAKTEGIDPQEHADIQRNYRHDPVAMKAAVKGSKVRDARYTE